ncbi:MAG: hypothetical protein WEC14_00855 [Chloroflexota bacterium]
MTSTGRRWRPGDGSAAVRGWVAFYTLGLPASMRTRRRSEVAGDLGDEALDAVRRGRQRQLFAQRLRRLMAGVPDDLAWRFVDAPAMARHYRTVSTWTPPTRWSMALLAIVAIGTAGAFAIGTLPILFGADAGSWAGWSRAGFSLACVGILIGIGGAVFWPARGAAIVVVSAIVGSVTTPWLWGGWLLAIIAVAVRGYGSQDDAAHDLIESGR